jgi:hypothetical protein
MRIGGHHSSIYGGTGEAGEATAARWRWLSAARREVKARLRQMRRDDAQELADRLAEVEDPIVQYCNDISTLFDKYMRVSGWHLHYRAWRRTGKLTRRIMQIQGYTDINAAIEAEAARREFERGDVEMMIGKYGGDTPAVALGKLVERVSDDPMRREAIRRRCQRLQAELEGASPTAIERILARRIVLCDLDAAYADILATAAVDAGVDYMFVELYDRRRSRAHKRLLAAARALAVVRRRTLAGD